METVKRKVDEYTYVSDWKTTADLLSSEFKDIPKLWDPFFPKTGIVSLVGSSDCGKSTLARNLAINIVLGKPSFAGNDQLTIRLVIWNFSRRCVFIQGRFALP